MVTVVIPSYNHGKFVAAAVQSILNQTYKNIELLVFDDGSQDDSREILQVLAEKHGFYFEPQENMGLTKTLNKALKRARGKYFCMLSSDDIVFPDKLEKQVLFMEKRPDVGLCGGSAIIVDEGGVCDEKQNVFPYSESEFDDVFLMRKKLPHSVTMIARADVLREIGGYDTEIALEDIDVWLRVSYAGYKIVCLNDVFAYYRKHPENTYKKIEFMTNCLLKSYEKYSDHQDYENMKCRIMRSALLKASKTNRPFAKKLLKEIPLGRYNSKVFRSLVRMIRVGI